MAVDWTQKKRFKMCSLFTHVLDSDGEWQEMGLDISNRILYYKSIQYHETRSFSSVANLQVII